MTLFSKWAYENSEFALWSRQPDEIYIMERNPTGRYLNFIIQTEGNTCYEMVAGNYKITNFNASSVFDAFNIFHNRI